MVATLPSPSSACFETNSPQFSGRIIDDPAALESLVPAWRDLVARCAWRNPCYEPEFLIPLLKHRGDESVGLLVIEGASAMDTNRHLYGVMPLVSKSFYRLPIRSVHAWRPVEAFDSTPLLDREHGDQALSAIFTTLSGRGVRLLAFDTVSADAAFDGLIRRAATQQDRAVFTRDRFSRAAMHPGDDADTYLRQSMSKNRRKKAKRLLKKLQAVGSVSLEHSSEANDVHQWAHDFVDLEAAGWKGRQGTAMACRSESLAFFLEMVDRCAQQDSIRFGRLTLDGAPIAMLVDLHSGGQVSGYKTTYDERFAEYSPGFLLEMQNVHWLHELGCTVCDSCTDPNNELINGLYAQRLAFQSIAIGLDSGMHWPVTSLLPWMQSSARFAKSCVRRIRR
ncbi:GNAT family N-acetyltransferase [Rhodopirellula sp. JC639]|uniref:GNAT family N-acetyltransferase n=1 Tax=Stieleria mannarensis TaxID=2755585 RepID=UPI001C71C76A|nr:GNAT family N-acetyltransferase [Rhodopirellula sp. JC639]